MKQNPILYRTEEKADKLLKPIKKIYLKEPAERKEPEILFEEEGFAVVYKPQGLPTAPLKEGETSLLTWFLNIRSDAANVKGKKHVEAGLLHRLDTATCGLVLIAKEQRVFDFLNKMQGLDEIGKTYFAFCNKDGIKSGAADSKLYISEKQVKTPFIIESEFLPFGVKGKTVKPVFEGSKKFSGFAKIYTTKILKIKKENISGVCGSIAAVNCEDEIFSCLCFLTQGYRHQVRSHLAAAGMPICGDALYNSMYISKASADKERFKAEKERHSYPLQLYALGLEFPNPVSGADKNCRISFLLPLPNKMSL